MNKVKRWIFLSLVFLIIQIPGMGWAHTPHDPIDGMSISPEYVDDSTAYIIIADHLLKTIDGGVVWKELSNGLDHKSLLTSIVVSPGYKRNGEVYVASSSDGIYKSTNRGGKWKKINSGLDDVDITELVALSSNELLALGAEGQLYKTDNGGQKWRRVLANVTMVEVLYDNDVPRLYIGDSFGMLLDSKDRGGTWSEVVSMPKGVKITTLAAKGYSPVHDLYIGTLNDGIYKLVNGKRLIELNNGLLDKKIRSIHLVPNGKLTNSILAVSWYKGVFRLDENDKWNQYGLGLTKDDQADTVTYNSPHFRDFFVAADGQEKGESTLFLSGFDGLFKSQDSGATWVQLETLPVGLIKGLSVSPRNNSAQNIAISTYGGGAYIYSEADNSWAISNRGLITTRLSDIEFSPNYVHDNTIFAGSIGRLLKSTNGGENWQVIALKYGSWRKKIASGLRRVGLPQSLYRQALTFVDTHAVYPTAIAVSPNYEFDQTLFFGTRWHGIYKSAEGGKNAQQLWDGEGAVVTSLIVSPGYAQDKTLYSAIRGKGVFKSEDEGESWEPINTGLAFLSQWENKTHHEIKKKDISLKVSPNFVEDHIIFLGASEGLYKTVNGGLKWDKVLEGYVIGFNVSPSFRQDKTVIASLKGLGMFKSVDRGNNFSRFGAELIQNNHSIEYIDFSSKGDEIAPTVYVASDEQLFSSKTQGESWALITRPVRYENHRDDVLRYTGSWDIVKKSGVSATTISLSDQKGDALVFDFSGTGVRIIGTMGKDQGIADIYLDGELVQSIDQYSDSRKNLVNLYSNSELEEGAHRLSVIVRGEKNTKSKAVRIEIDAIDLLP